jgi:hypothetical protein
VFDQCDKAVELDTAGATLGQVYGDAGELGAGGLRAELALDVAFEHRAADPAARVPGIDLEDHFEEDAVAR